MYKKIIAILLLVCVTHIHSISLSNCLLKNSSAHYLVDLARFINDLCVTQQVGQELFLRNYLSLVTTYDPRTARFDEKPTTPAEGYNAHQGQWVWVASSAMAETGTWVWIERTISVYVLIMNHQEMEF